MSTSRTKLILRIGAPVTATRKRRMDYELKAIASTLKGLPLEAKGVAVYCYDTIDRRAWSPALMWQAVVRGLHKAGIITTVYWPRACWFESQEGVLPRLHVTITH